MRGQHSLKHWSVTQSTVTLSSAESKLGGSCKGSSVSLGLISVARDLCVQRTLAVETDAAAAIGISHRRGLGKVRHLAVADLWVPDRVRSGDFILRKVAGSQNLRTFWQNVEGALLWKPLERIGACEGGRASCDGAKILNTPIIPGVAHAGAHSQRRRVELIAFRHRGSDWQGRALQ